MTKEALSKAVHRNPFQPFVLRLVYSFELIRGVWSGVVGGVTWRMSWLGRGSEGGLVCRDGSAVERG